MAREVGYRKNLFKGTAEYYHRFRPPYPAVSLEDLRRRVPLVGTGRSRATTADGPAVVLTLGRLRLSQARRFLRASRPAEAAALEAPGLIWGTAMAKPPFVATCSLWESATALSRYAYGQSQPAHPDAIAVDAAKPFHKQSVFIRFRPYGATGSLDGLNPLATGALATSSSPSTSSP